jgi:anti-anti-sigma factor
LESGTSAVIPRMPLPPRSPRPTVVVDVEGGFRGESGAAQIQAKLRGLLSMGYECILVNVADVTYIDSVTLGALVQAYVSAMRFGTTVKLLHATRRVKELLAVTKLNRVLETVDSEEENRG